MTEPAKKIDAEADRRRTPRAALRLSATMREAGRGRTSVKVIDISTHGCRIEASTGASADSWLWLSIAGLETQYCRVVWRYQEFAGLEFATPLAEAVLERLLQDTKQVSEATINELRDIANRTHMLAKRQQDDQTESLVELSNKCAVEALVEALRLGEAQNGEAGPRR